MSAATKAAPTAVLVNPAKAIDIGTLKKLAGLDGTEEDATLIGLSAASVLMLDALVGEMQRVGQQLTLMATSLGTLASKAKSSASTSPGKPKKKKKKYKAPKSYTATP